MGVTRTDLPPSSWQMLPATLNLSGVMPQGERMTKWWAVCLLVGLASCSTPSLQIGTQSDGQADSVGVEVAVPDAGFVPDVGLDEGSLFGDGAPFETTLPECEAGTGCFLAPCDANEDCLAGWCVEHMGESVCTKTCQEECPPGWSCKQAGTGEPDMAWICVSAHAHLCKPCVESNDCQGVGGTEDVCVDYGQSGSFCGGLCGSDDECPWGFSCVEAETVDGIAVMQCVADAGECPCTPKSVALGLFTDCNVSNEYGTCRGKRVCQKDGLSPCDAAMPAAETCNGIDDDCDGDIDEPYDLTVDPPIGICDDGNSCTANTCDGEAGCQVEVLDEGECVDGDACTVGDHCQAGECIGLPVACDDGNPCTDDLCDGLGGCAAEFNQEPCDDGDPCTVNDRCEQGTCSGFAVSCDCTQDEDCLAYDDGDLCTGTLYCDESSVPFLCKLVPDSPVTCPLPPGADPICQAPACNGDSGECGVAAANEGYACDDGNACTVGEKCSDGSCAGGVALLCNDGNVCTADSCDPEAGCLFVATDGPCSDDDVCTVGDFCADAVCQSGPEQLMCDDGNECTEDSCDTLKGCLHLPLSDLACDDGNACTQGDMCAQGKCVFATDVDCDDENPCTTDNCLASFGCIHLNNKLPCTDENACTVADQCAGGQCLSGTPLDCDDGNPCTVDGCDPVLGCLNKPLDDVPCSDGNACTTGDVCQEGTCLAGGALNCDDSNPCTDDSCQAASGCQHVTHSLPCDDGNLCSLGDVCSEGECIAGSPLDCDDQNPCTLDNCDPLQGCVYKSLTGEACDDGDACTVAGHCTAGQCVSNPLECDDDNPCTDDFCDPATGCIHTLNKAPCDDGDLCTINDTCQLGECLSSGPLNCMDGNPCTEDGCSPEVGCTFKPIKGECDDNNACTLNEQCQNGFCTASGWLDCDDENPCTNDLCSPLSGCLNQFNTVPCNDGNPCTANDACFEGNCKSGGPAVCNDNNPCTDDSCDPASGCVYVNNTAACDDGDSCTASDKCADGICLPGQPLICNDGNPCTDDSCDSELACVYVANSDPCNDGNNCTDNAKDLCVGGECVGGPLLDCDDQNPCTVDTCSEAFACEYAKVPDGDDCGGDDVCWKGECVACGDLTGSQTFSYTGSVQEFPIPPCVDKLTIEAWGAQGGNASIGVVFGGKGGYVKGTLAVTPGETLRVHVGGQGTVTTGGWNGGGNGGAKGSCGGGGASDVRYGGTTLTHRVAVGAGGGGAAWESAWSGGWGVNNGACNGGAGGGLTGNKGGYWQSDCQGGDGGTQASGGVVGGALGLGGNAEPGDGDTGGGGGGWYGGGGGGACTGHNGCGGGGSSYVGGLSNGSTLGGQRSGHGQVTISW